MKINGELYARLKAAVLSGDYTVREVADALDWLRIEYIRKRTVAARSIKASEVESLPDWYDADCHRREDAPSP